MLSRLSSQPSITRTATYQEIKAAESTPTLWEVLDAPRQAVGGAVEQHVLRPAQEWASQQQSPAAQVAVGFAAALKGFAESVAGIISPLAYYETAKFVGGLVDDPEHRAKVAEYFALEPARAWGELAGGVAGMFAGGKVLGKAIELSASGRARHVGVAEVKETAVVKSLRPGPEGELYVEVVRKIEGAPRPTPKPVDVYEGRPFVEYRIDEGGRFFVAARDLEGRMLVGRGERYAVPKEVGGAVELRPYHSFEEAVYSTAVIERKLLTGRETMKAIDVAYERVAGPRFEKAVKEPVDVEAPRGFETVRGVGGAGGLEARGFEVPVEGGKGPSPALRIGPRPKPDVLEGLEGRVFYAKEVVRAEPLPAGPLPTPLTEPPRASTPSSTPSGASDAFQQPLGRPAELPKELPRLEDLKPKGGEAPSEAPSESVIPKPVQRPELDEMPIVPTPRPVVVPKPELDEEVVPIVTPTPTIVPRQEPVVGPSPLEVPIAIPETVPEPLETPKIVPEQAITPIEVPKTTPVSPPAPAPPTLPIPRPSPSRPPVLPPLFGAGGRTRLDLPKHFGLAYHERRWRVGELLEFRGFERFELEPPRLSLNLNLRSLR